MHKALKAAVYSALTGDVALMAKVQAVFQGRIPPDSGVVGRDKGVLTYDLETTLIGAGFKHDVLIAVDVWTHSLDLADDIAKELYRLLGPSAPVNQWKPLTLSGGDRALVRVESEDDIRDITSELAHKVLTIRCRFARKFP